MLNSPVQYKVASASVVTVPPTHDSEWKSHIPLWWNLFYCVPFFHTESINCPSNFKNSCHKNINSGVSEKEVGWSKKRLTISKKCKICVRKFLDNSAGLLREHNLGFGAATLQDDDGHS